MSAVSRDNNINKLAYSIYDVSLVGILHVQGF